MRGPLVPVSANRVWRQLTNEIRVAVCQIFGLNRSERDYASLTNERVQEAARSLLASADRIGSDLYLKYLVLQGGPWAAIEEVLPTTK